MLAVGTILWASGRARQSDKAILSRIDMNTARVRAFIDQEGTRLERINLRLLREIRQLERTGTVVLVPGTPGPGSQPPGHHHPSPSPSPSPGPAPTPAPTPSPPIPIPIPTPMPSPICLPIIGCI